MASRPARSLGAPNGVSPTTRRPKSTPAVNRPTRNGELGTGGPLWPTFPPTITSASSSTMSRRPELGSRPCSG